jgi:hypothetical protein
MIKNRIDCQNLHDLACKTRSFFIASNANQSKVSKVWSFKVSGEAQGHGVAGASRLDGVQILIIPHGNHGDNLRSTQK